ncbi:PREDICTED: nuclear pore complex protein Nup155-like [Rhagoletis zephyria]|uniref:nuclear pore complex protein Nup155-like n=1 Tax=Rhagoletis zephyria TaxID=28612 RepID=UPI0008117BF4|nr:PREDICTED: nuclear pore complex protein Nup155-like [Rhagoletis zephyria]
MAAPDTSNILEVITNFVDTFLQQDSCFPQLADTLKLSQGVSISGLQDVDYPNLEEFGNSLKTLSQFVGLKNIPLPKMLIDQFGQMVQRCEMGIFTEIGRAWLAIDTNIYLWKYDTGTDVAYYDALSRLITNVGFVKPREGVFKSHIKYILVLVTFDEITLLGITFSDIDNADDMGDLLVIPEPIFTIPTDNIEIKVIKGTEDGRIFLGGSDGCLYEITYQADNGWFGRKCRKINHSTSAFSFLVPKILKTYNTSVIVQIEVDKTRNVLFTLSEEGDIEVFDLGTDGKSASRVFYKSVSSIAKEAQSVARTIDEVNFKKIVSINAIEESESIHINLVAVTQTGVRLYFTTTALNSPEMRPFSLTLMHIRLPPGFAASSLSHRPSSVHMSYYKRGNFIFISSFDNKDTLWALSNDTFAFNTELSELFSIIPLNNKIWSMAEEAKVVEFKPYQCVFVKNKTFALEAPSTVTQHIEAPKKFVFLTTQGVIVGYKPRIVDQLKQLLMENQGYDNEAVKSFFLLHSSPQTNACAVALIIACDSHPPGEERLIEWATSAFFHYGSDPIVPSAAYNQHIQALQANKPVVSTPNSNPTSPGGDGSNFMLSPGMSIPRSTDTSFALSPIRQQYVQNMSPQTTPQMQAQNPNFIVHPNVQLPSYSLKCRGLFIYFSRIIRPIWKLKTVSIKVTVSPEGATKEHLASNISIDEIKVYLLRLSSLCNFLRSNMKFSQPESDKYHTNLTRSPFVFGDIQATERQLIFGLFNLIQHCVEVLNLWKLLCVHQFHVIVSTLLKDKQTQLSNMTFQELIVFGSEMTTILASALVRRFIEDNSTTDIINKRLQDLCPSIYKNENALHAKAHEMVIKARSLTNENDRKVLLENALELCKKIGARINLAAICELFQTVHWYEAIVDICLTTAQNCDPQNIALHYYKNKEHMDDQQGKMAFNARLECFNLLLEIYGRLCQQSKAVLSPRTPDPSQSFLTPDAAKAHANTILRLATQSSDELFHYTLYNWLYEHGQNDKLLEIKSSYLENFLKEKTTELQDSIALMDFLWMFYERNGHFNAAAQILSKLADQQSTDISLVKRIEYLSRAIVCMKSLDTRLMGASFGKLNSAGEFLHILEEKMEVARIQMQLLDSIEKLPQPQHYEDAIRVLNSSLHNVTTLYKDFAEPFQLFECQLKILHCAGHEDLNLIENIWRNIIDKELMLVANKEPETQKNLLKNKIRELGSLYLNTDKYFPIELIINILETATQSSSFEPYWLAETLLELNMRLVELFEIYHKIYKARVYGATLDPIHLLQILIYLINQLGHCHMSSSERDYFMSKSLDVISGYLIDCKTFDINDPRVKTINSELNKTRLFLERSTKSMY